MDSRSPIARAPEMPPDRHARRRSPLDPAPLAFRPFTLGDVPLLHQWAAHAHVYRWWYEGAPPTAAKVNAEHVSDIRGETATHPYAVLYGGIPIGYIQMYRIDAYPEYAAQIEVDNDAVGLDLYIGDPEYVYRGLGAPLLRAFLQDVVFADPTPSVCVLGPDPENTAAIRAYEKAGFRYLKQVAVVGEPAPEYLMRITRADVTR